MHLLAIDNEPMPYAWGARGGISALLGRERSEQLEAELWLGSHHRAPSRIVDSNAPWPDLHAWEIDQQQNMAFLMKILDAAAPLSIQAHPTAEQAEAGWQREEGLGIPRDAGERNYRDPRPKPEMIIALRDGFEALCGFRTPEEVIADLDHVIAQLQRDQAEAPLIHAMSQWRQQLSASGPHETMAWLLSGDETTVAVVQGIEEAARHLLDQDSDALPTELPEQLHLVPRLATEYPRDAGIAVAFMLNYVRLAAGEALWLPAGNVHAYLYGMGMELMGPSDNVLRGGLTPKHIDTDELLHVVNPMSGPAQRLRPELDEAGGSGRVVQRYRTAAAPHEGGAGFELIRLTAASAREEPVQFSAPLPGPAVLAVLDGEFSVTAALDSNGELSTRTAQRGTFLFATESGTITIQGHGEAYLAVERSD